MVVSDRMTEANEQDQEQKRPLTPPFGRDAGLRKPVEAGQVRQSFSQRTLEAQSHRSTSVRPRRKRRLDSDRRCLPAP